MRRRNHIQAAQSSDGDDGERGRLGDWVEGLEAGLRKFLVDVKMSELL